MPGWVALLRAVNVGGRNRVPMAELRALLEGLGHEDVVTYIASGNVVFRSDTTKRAELAGQIERAIESEFGVSTVAILRSFAEMRKLVRAHPFGPDTSKSYVTLLAAKPKAADVKRLAALDVGPDRVEVVGSDVFILYPNGLQAATVSGPLLEKTLGLPGTNRNWRTVAKLAELCAGG